MQKHALSLVFLEKNMISSVQLLDTFAALPYLATSQLWRHNSTKKGLKFSIDKPNVIVGPNGAGKTALLTLLSLQTLSHFTGESALDDNFTRGLDCDAWWSERTWRNDPEFLPGAKFVTDNAPAAFYRPGHISGNDKCITSAMMSGYFNEAKTYAQAVEAKSSGQGCQALLERLIAALAGAEAPRQYHRKNWSGGKEPVDLAGKGWCGPWDYRAEVLKARVAAVPPNAVPLILLDEPEQSLDTKAELNLWRAIETADCTTRQIVVATHSLYPFLKPKSFNLIEATPGYVASVRADLGL